MSTYSQAETGSKRRKPRQQRARNTVDRILQAALVLIEEQSFNDITTNHIAERAGVNIGSLYQYFANREGIALALYEDVTSQVALQIRSRIYELNDLEFDAAVFKLVELFYTLFEKHRTVLIDLQQDLPQLRDRAHGVSVDNLIHGANRTLLEQHRSELNYEDVEVVLFFAANNLMSNIRAYIQQSPDHITRKTFVNELSKSLINYLKYS